jgi:hypothetical protein
LGPNGWSDSKQARTTLFGLVDLNWHALGLLQKQKSSVWAELLLFLRGPRQRNVVVPWFGQYLLVFLRSPQQRGSRNIVKE